MVGAMNATGPCALCGDPIDPDQAAMANVMTGQLAHSGCVYRDERAPERAERWQPATMDEAADQRRTTASGDVARQS